MAAVPRAESERSSPLSDVGSNITEESIGRIAPPTRRYRDATEAPENFKEQIQILFDEDLRDLAIQSLQSNLLAQSYLSADRPLWVSPASHIAFLGTLVIHPAHTTKANDDDKNIKIVSVRAYQYLVDVLRSIGPINGHFKAAFAFRDQTSRLGRRRRHSPDPSDLNLDYDTLTTKLAHSDSIWNRVPDFWAMLGWAFACAVSHPERWAHWKLWVEFLLEVMKRDVEERYALDEELGDKKYGTLRSSIVASYIGEHQLGHIMRVLFAYVDGETHSYQEVWPKETQNTTATNKRKLGDIAEVDLDRGVYGGWDEDDQEDESEEEFEFQPEPENKPRIGKKKKGQNKKQVLPLVDSPLLEETIPIRRLIFELVSLVCFHVKPPPFTLDDLYSQYAKRILDLPLDVFPHFVSADQPLQASMYVTLAQNMLSWLLPPHALRPQSVESEMFLTKGFVSPVMLEKCYLPYAPNSVVKVNARMAVVLWELFIFLWDHEECALGSYIEAGEEKFEPMTERMRRAIETGLEAREKKCKIKADDARDCDQVMESIEQNRYSPANVLRLAHLKFRLFIRKENERAAASRGGKSWGPMGKGKLSLLETKPTRLGGPFIEWKAPPRVLRSGTRDA